MNERETRKFQKLVKLISSYSEDLSASEKEAALTKVNELAAYEIDIYELDTYWKSQSIEEFSTRLAIEIIQPATLNENQILKALNSICDEEDVEILDYLLCKYSDAIEHHFQKSSGTLIDILNDEDDDTFDKIVAALNESDTICL